MNRLTRTLAAVCLMLAGFLPAQRPPGAEAARTAPVQTIAASRFQEAFRRFIAARLEKGADDIIVSRFQAAGSPELPPGAVSLQVLQKTPGELDGYVRLAAMVRVNDVPCAEVQLSAWVDVFETVVCAARNLDKGAVIGREDIRLVRRNIARMHDAILTDTGQAIGRTLSQDVREDGCLKDWMLKKTALVDRGDMVTIVAQGAGITVTVPGRILEKGYAGEYVRVQNTMSRKNIFAKVLNGTTVQVDF